MRTSLVVGVALAGFAACKGGSSENRTGSGSAAGSETAAGSGTAAGSAARPPAPTPVGPPVPLAADPGGATGKPKWATSFGGLGTDYARAVAVGAGGQIAVAGYFDGDSTFGKLGVRKSNGGSDVFVAGLAADGTPAWVQTFGDKRDDVANGVAVGKDGTTVVVGNFLDAVEVAGLKAKAAGSDDLFAAAFDKSGKPLWLWTAGGINSDGADCVIATPDGGWLVGGSFIGEAKFGDKIYTAEGGHDAMLIKLAPTGEVKWMQQMGGAYNDSINALAVDGQGNIYMLGEFVDTAKFGGPALPNQGNAGADLAVVKLDPDGKHIWSKSLGSKTADAAGGIAVDPAGNVTITGSFEGVINVDGKTYEAIGQFDIIAAHYDTNGVVQWVKTWGGDGTDIGAAVAADSAGNAIVVGWFEGRVVFDDKVMTSHGNRDMVAIKLAPKGTITWIDVFGDHDHDQARAVAVDPDGNPVVAGVYRFRFDAVEPPLESVRVEGDKHPPNADVVVLELSR